MTYRVVHRTEYRYDDVVTAGYNEARLTPRTFDGQRCRASTIEILPAPADRRSRTDFFGNDTLYFAIQEPHDRLTVTAVSDVDVAEGPADDLLADRTPWDDVRALLTSGTEPDVLEARAYTLDSPLVRTSGELARFAEPSFAPGTPLIAGALDLIARIRAGFAYEPGATTTSTPLAEVLDRRAGVCQDFAHLAVGALRSLGLAARYVSGYLETEPPPGQPKLVGADASHAWASLFVPGLGWLDLDPTNDAVVGERHVVTAWGRDYADVTPLKGVVFSNGRGHHLDVAVDVTRVP